VPVEPLDQYIVRQCQRATSPAQRKIGTRTSDRATFGSRLPPRNGVVTLCIFTSPCKNIRDQSRREIGEFLDV